MTVPSTKAPKPGSGSGSPQGATPFAASDCWISSSLAAGISCSRGMSAVVSPSSSSVRSARAVAPSRVGKRSGAALSIEALWNSGAAAGMV